VRSKPVKNRAAWVAESKQLGNLVVRFPCRIVSRFPHQAIDAGARGFKQMRVTAAGNQRQCRVFQNASGGLDLSKNRMDVALDMVDPDQGDSLYQRQRLGVGNAHQQASDKARTASDGYCIDVAQLDAGLLDCAADNRDDGPQMLARGQFGNNTAVLAMHVDLRGDHAGKDDSACSNDSCRRFVTGTFNS